MKPYVGRANKRQNIGVGRVTQYWKLLEYNIVYNMRAERKKGRSPYYPLI